MSACAVARLASLHLGGRAVLEAVDLELRAGEVLGIIGPNGGGKSSLLFLFAGLLRPTAGAVDVLGMAAHALPARRSGQVGLLTANPGLYPLLTGWENLRFFMGLFGMSPAQIEERSTVWVERTGLAEAMTRPVGGWSTGMQQRLSLVRALMLEPRVLLLDEPTANLDPLAAHTIQTAMREVAERGVAVAWVTHDLMGADAICDRVAVLNRRLGPVLAGRGAALRPSPLLAHYQGAL